MILSTEPSTSKAKAIAEATRIQHQADAEKDRQAAETNRLRLQAQAEFENAQMDALRRKIETMGADAYAKVLIEEARSRKIDLPGFVGGSGSSGFMDLAMAKMLGIEVGPSHPAAEQKHQLTVDQIDLVVQALRGYVKKEGGADEIRALLMDVVASGRNPQLLDTTEPIDKTVDSA
jgi:uncharacterized membrane protein YqiK